VSIFFIGKNDFDCENFKETAKNEVKNTLTDVHDKFDLFNEKIKSLAVNALLT